MLMQEYAEEARLLIQEIDAALSVCSNVLSRRLFICLFFLTSGPICFFFLKVTL